MFDQIKNEIILTDSSDEIHSKTIRHLKVSPEENFVAAGSFDGTISIWANVQDSSNFIYYIPNFVSLDQYRPNQLIQNNAYQIMILKNTYLTTPDIC